MRKIGFFNIGRLGLVRTWQVETNINEIIEKWIPKHMVFWYDMAKPVDVYIPGVTYANQFINDGGKLSYDITINKCTITHTPTTANKNFWQTPCSPSSAVSSFKIRVTGLPQGFSIESGIYPTKITSDGEYDIPEYKSSGTTTRYPGFYLTGDNVNDVDCNIVVEEIPTRQSVPTNEILKSNPYLQDFSGNNRPLKLNNFLFAAMSGVGGYEYNWLDSALFITYLSGARGDGTITDNTITINNVKVSSGVIETRVSSPSKKYKVRVTGITSNETLRYVIYGDTSLGELVTIIFDMKKDGEYELPASTYSATYNMKWQVIAASYPHTCNITIEQIPSYPNALVTDGVDDYGQIQNLQHGVKVLFVTINPFIDGKFIYDQRLNTTEPWLFAVFNDKGSIAYNSRNSNGKTYIDGTLNESTIVSALLNKKQIVTIVNNDVTGDKTKTPIFFSNADHNSGWISSAFYNSFGFDSVPTKQDDGFTEQDLIDYYIPKAIVTITVVDVSGSPIQDATVTVGGVQYKTLSDGTVKVRGMANGTMSLSVKKDGYMPFSNNSWKLADSRITLEVLRNTVITENGYSILLENDGLILTE